MASNVREHGTGALNIDGCRIEGDPVPVFDRMAGDRSRAEYRTGTGRRTGESSAVGRWPANVILDPDAATELDRQSGTLISGANPRKRGADQARAVLGDFVGQEEVDPARGAESGGASRFFYVAKASRAERNVGLDDLPEHGSVAWDPTSAIAREHADNGWGVTRNFHPTVKPISLMRHLVCLVTPPGGIVVDPFTGSGTTAIAAHLEGFRCIGIERIADYLPLALARIAFWTQFPRGTNHLAVLPAKRKERPGQGALAL